ncbi:MAG TPA: response regulator [Blastocatellia bacterium]|nr:response regulator [Blastocatellia bacterium]
MKDGMTKKALLVVDDDVEWTDLLRVFFSNKYAVSVANHADQAIEAIRREAPHVIILDLIMPSVDGFGLMHRMKDILPKTVPTVLTTGWGGSDLKESAESVGCVAVLSKPVSLTELETLVSSLMDGSYNGGSQIGPETSVNAARNTGIDNRNYER